MAATNPAPLEGMDLNALLVTVKNRLVNLSRSYTTPASPKPAITHCRHRLAH